MIFSEAIFNVERLFNVSAEECYALISFSTFTKIT